MAFVRSPPAVLRGAALDAALRAAGFRIGPAPREIAPPLEQVVASVVAEALPTDFRLLSVATTWLAVHGERLHVAELARVLHAGVDACDDAELYAAYWGGVAQGRRRDARWGKVARRFAGPRVYLGGLSPELAEAQLSRKGEDPRFVGSRLAVPRGLLRDRPTDVDDPTELARRHPWYRERLRQGPTYRADCWAEIERSPSVAASVLARRVGCSYPVAHAALADWRIVAAATS